MFKFADCHSQKVSICWLILHRLRPVKLLKEPKQKILVRFLGWGIRQNIKYGSQKGKRMTETKFLVSIQSLVSKFAVVSEKQIDVFIVGSLVH